MPIAMDPGTTPSLRRISRRALPTLATIAGVALFVAAGHWQQGRMHEKEALRAQQDAAATAPALGSADLRFDADWPALRYRRVSLTGKFDGRRQIFVDNKVHDGHVGYDVVAPFLLSDGRAVLVDRGWIAQGASRRELPVAPPPDGVVTIAGRIAPPAGGRLELKSETGTGPVLQNLDPARFAAAFGIAVLPVVVEQTAGEGADTLVRDWPVPDAGIEKHRIYMVQWYAFAALAVVLWTYFHFLRGKRGD